MRVVVYGSRPDGHARVVVETLLAGSDFDVVGLIDDEPRNTGRQIGELRVVGSRASLPTLAEQGVEGLVLGFGGTTGRDEVVDAVERAGLAMPILVHPSVHLSGSATLDSGVQVLPHASIGPGSHLGRGVLVNTGAIIEHDVILGDNCVVDPGAVLAGRVSLGDSVEVGTGAIVLPDVSVAARAKVGAGAVVTRPVEEGETVMGVPARPQEGQQAL